MHKGFFEHLRCKKKVKQDLTFLHNLHQFKDWGIALLVLLYRMQLNRIILLITETKKTKMCSEANINMLVKDNNYLSPACNQV